MPKAATVSRSPINEKTGQDKAVKKTTVKKTAARKHKGPLLMTCPANGQGWCPYPFSIEQLEKRLKEKALVEAGAGK